MSCVKTDEIVTLFTMHIAGTVLYNHHFLVTTSKYAYRMLQILVGLWLTEQEAHVPCRSYENHSL